MSDQLLCVGGAAHGQYAKDVGACLIVPVLHREPLSEIELQRKVAALRHGPGYRRRFSVIYPPYRPPRIECDRYVKRRLVREDSSFVEVYGLEFTDDRWLMREALALLRLC